MNRIVLVAPLLLAVVLAVVYAQAQDKPMPKEGGPIQMGMCPGCGMMMTGTMSKEMMDMAKEIMTDAGITDEMMMQHKGMMMAPMYMDEAASLQGMSKSLELTDDQKAKLMDIQKDARAKALAVLTDDQKKKLGKVADKPMSMMDCMKMMHEKVMPVLEKRMKDGKKIPPCCEMMMKMQMPKKDETKPMEMPMK